MPNWVKTIVKTKPDVIKDIMKNYSEKNVFSFNKVIPMPKDLDIESGSKGEDGMMFLYLESTNDIYKLKINEAYKERNMFNTDIYREKRFGEIEEKFEQYKNDSNFKESIELGKKYIENFQKYGHCTWYGWCCEHWGTKWDLSNFSHNEDTIMFHTAWGFAGDVILELSKNYPSAMFKCEFADEGIKENSGIVEIKNGEVFKEKYDLSEYKINKIWDEYIPEYDEELEMEM